MDNKKTKDSGIEWIGEIPEDWKKNRFKYSGRFVKGKIPNTINSEGIGIPYIGASEMNSREFKNFTEDSSVVLCDEKDILILWDGANAGNVATDLQGVVSSTIVKYSLYNKKAVQRYVYYLLKYAEKYFKDKVNGTTIPHMNPQYIDDIPLLLPSMSVQENIADFLDKKCSQIDELIANNQSQIDKLKEYKQSVITQAVTKGLDPNVETKDSGIDWIGQIPKTWEVVRIKNIAHFNPVIKINQGIETISYAPMECVKNGWLIHKEISVNNISSGLTLFEENDIVMAKVTPCFENGNIAIATDLKNGIACGSSELFVFRSKNKFNKWLFYFLRNNIFKQRASATMTGTGGLKRVSPKFVSDYSLALPSLLEQQQIADYLDKKCSQIDSLIELKQQKIEKLQEYKKSLIYEYVTGKKEVG